MARSRRNRVGSASAFATRMAAVSLDASDISTAVDVTGPGPAATRRRVPDGALAKMLQRLRL
jgi:hypothetical protein